MLSFLVTSKARRRLLLLLWGRGVGGSPQSGSVSDLAVASRVVFSSAHKELAAMKKLGLVRTSKDGGKTVFYANEDHPQAALLRELVAAEQSSALLPATQAEDELVAKLRILGAPLANPDAVGELQLKAVDMRLMALVAKSVALARQRPDVAKALPVLFAKRSDEFSYDALRALRLPADDKRALGFLLDMAGDVAGNPRLSTLAEAMQDKRVSKLHAFFVDVKAKRKTSSRSFPLADKWGFSMAMDHAAFRDMYRKAKVS